MECYNIDTSYTGYSNNEVFKMIKMILSNEVKEINTSYKRLLSISHLILYITDDNLLNPTIRLLKESNLLINEKQIEKPLYNLLKNLIYSEKDCTRIRAFVYSNLLMNEVKITHWKDGFKGNFPELKFKMEGRNIYVNNNEIDTVLKKNVVNYVINDVVEILEPHNQINEFKKMINSMAKIDYSNETKYFKDDIKYLSILKENNNHNYKLLKPFSDFFKDLESFLIFDKFMKKQLVNPYKDISFLFQMLNSEKRLLNIKHIEFAEMLFKTKYIKEKDFDYIYGKKGFDNKSNSDIRLNNYFNIVSEIDGINT